MSFAPEDPRRHEEENFALKIIEAHARILELAYSQCAEIRELFTETKVEDMNVAEKSSRVQLKAVQYEYTDGMTVKVLIGIEGGMSIEGKKDILLITEKDQTAQLRPRIARQIFRLLEPEMRETIAEYMAAKGHQEVTEEMDEISQYEDLQDMRCQIDKLKECIIAGKIPTPKKPLPWKRGYGSPNI